MKKFIKVYLPFILFFCFALFCLVLFSRSEFNYNKAKELFNEKNNFVTFPTNTEQISKLFMEVFPPDSIAKYYKAGNHNFEITISIDKQKNIKCKFLYYLINGESEGTPLMYYDRIPKQLKDDNFLYNLVSNNTAPGNYRIQFVTRIGLNNKAVEPYEVYSEEFQSFIKKPRLKNVVYNPDVMPEYIEGNDKMYETIQKEIVYPEAARKRGKSGTALITTYIDSTGKVCDFEPYTQIGDGCEAEAMKVIAKLKFKPAIKSGKPVTTSIDIPVTFILEYKGMENKHYDNYDLIAIPIDTRATMRIAVDSKTTKTFNNNTDEIAISFGYKVINGQLREKQTFERFLYIDGKLTTFDKASFAYKNSSLFFNWKPTFKGTHKYKIVLDPDNKLNEKNRKNNALEGTFETK